MSDEAPDLLTITLGGPVGTGPTIARDILRHLPLQRLLRKNRVTDQLAPALARRIRPHTRTGSYFQELAEKLASEVDLNGELRAACDRRGGVSTVSGEMRRRVYGSSTSIVGTRA